MNYNDDDINSKLIDAYKNAKKLIIQDPSNKKNIIKDYIDLVLKFNNYQPNKNNHQEPSQTPALSPTSSDINIYNNFNALPNNAISGIDNINKNNKNIVDITKTSTRSIQELASTFNYINK